jgi:molybdate transport system substrate-binding protein
MFRVFLCALVSALLALSSPHSSLAQPQPVTAFAAASLQDALTGIAKKFTDQTRVPVRFSFGSSAALARQIDQGAPADLFAYADTDWMDWALARNLIKPQTKGRLVGQPARRGRPVRRKILEAGARTQCSHRGNRTEPAGDR